VCHFEVKCNYERSAEDSVRGRWGELRNKKLCSLYVTRNVIRLITSKGWSKNVAGMQVIRN
jgi:hypothetical protein